MYQSRDPMMEVMADDLASIQVDLALSNEGYQRTGRNMFFMVGSETTEKDTQ
jgi:formate dehydrogenase maturation protein FdhE